MSLPGLTNKEVLKLSRSLRTQDTKFIPELSPVEAGELLNKSISKGSSLKELSEYFGFSHTKMVSEMIKIYKNLDKELRHLVYFSRQPMYKRGLGYLTFDLARVIASHEINNQKELALTAIDYRFKRVDLEGIRQRMDRSGLSLREVIEEFKKRQGATTLITTLIGGFFDKKVLDIMKSSKKEKIFYKVLDSSKVKSLLSKNNKVIVQAVCNATNYSLTISGDKLTNKFKNDLDILIEEEIKNESR
tara:strand:+ start:1665 stop:2402 length:738 start_codon:yes stop_codon:yes gene_type:complete